MVNETMLKIENPEKVYVWYYKTTKADEIGRLPIYNKQGYQVGTVYIGKGTITEF